MERSGCAQTPVRSSNSTSSPSPPSTTPLLPSSSSPAMPPPLPSSSHTPLAPGQIYSQPALTGAGTHSSTILITALDALKAHGAPQRFDDFAITNGLTALLHDERLKERFKAHPRVMWNEKLELLSYKVRRRREGEGGWGEHIGCEVANSFTRTLTARTRRPQPLRPPHSPLNTLHLPYLTLRRHEALRATRVLPTSPRSSRSLRQHSPTIQARGTCAEGKGWGDQDGLLE